MRRKKKLFLIAADASIIWASIMFTTLLWDGNLTSLTSLSMYVFIGCASVAIIALMIHSSLYMRIWQYASIGELISLVRSVLIGSVVAIGVSTFITQEAKFIFIGMISSQTILLLLGAVRFTWRLYRDRNGRLQQRKMTTSALVIGAGDCGMMIARELKGNPESAMKIAAFIDDDPRKHNQQMLGIPIIGGREKIIEACEELDIDNIIIAMPSISKSAQSEIIDICNETKRKVQIVPVYQDLLTGKAVLQQIRDVQVEDLLGREPVNVDLQGIAEYVSFKTVLVTGAGGSIGSELCRQIVKFKPYRILLLGHGENSIFDIHTELTAKHPQLRVESIIADVKDLDRIGQVFQRYKPEIVFHAAAHKHVPLMEKNPMEAVKNNVFGTKNVAMCAKEVGCERFVLISTDKAVNPSSIMGTTKRIAEKIVLAMNNDKASMTKYCAVRFGNVLGSRGSVIPRFKEQIAAGGPVTVTDPGMVRYFMTIPEAVQLVIQAGALTDGGEVFILDMGKPVRIVKLAEDLIKLSGFQPYTEIDIEFTGIRPGEKLYEELLTEAEGVTATMHERIFIGKPEKLEMNEVIMQINRLENILGESNNRLVGETLREFVPEYIGVS